MSEILSNKKIKYKADEEYFSEKSMESFEETPACFIVGKTYLCSSLDAGTAFYRCIARTDSTVTFCESDALAWMDGINERSPYTYEIEKDEYGNERVFITSYYDHKFYICSNQ